jgi:protein arginine kinase
MMKQEVMKDLLPEWVKSEGEAGDVVISSRVRLARNLKGFPFPNYADEKQLMQIATAIKTAVQGQTEFGSLQLVPIEELSSNDRLVLVEKHLCSPQFIENPHLRLLLLNQKQSVSVMINEEDHLRIQTLTPGNSLDQSLEMANRVDDYLEKTLEYCFDERCGYLTACPTNVGTGIRASLMLHLPGLTMVDQIKRVLASLIHVGMNIRGLYGEGTESLGNIYQISNQVTLGHSEEELTSNLKSICRQVIEQERNVREALLKDSKLQLEDRLCRSFGILTQARLLNAQEALKLLSDVKLGAGLGIIPQINRVAIKELMFLIRASILQKISGKEMTALERDYYRAQIVRDRLKIKRGDNDV